MRRDFAALSRQSFDLLVCGGGIYGAWTAYDAALRGLKVAIIEQNDWASATSSASSKLIHGGLRYLETYDFKLVSKSLKERELLLQIAPHRVWPLQFGMPLYTYQRNHYLNRLKLKIGLMLYDWLAGKTRSKTHHRYLDAESLMTHFPYLRNNALKGSFIYSDAQTDDARLVLELIAGALDAGACCVNYCQFIQFLAREENLNGALIHDQVTEKQQAIYFKQIVFTTGQWLANDRYSQQWCLLAKGVHLIMPAVPGNKALLLTARSDGRVFFLIPWYGMTLLGTTDTEFRGDVTNVKVEPSDIRYLLDAVNDYLQAPWNEQDIIGHFVGVRVFKREGQLNLQDSPSSVSRDWELKSQTDDIHYSIGGKITSARQDAAAIVDKVCTQLGNSRSCATQQLFPWAPSNTFRIWWEQMQSHASVLGIDDESTHWLLRRHGTETSKIFHRIEKQPQLAQRIIPSLPFIYADLLHCAESEMVIHLDDLLRRRMPLLILTKLSKEQLQQIAQCVADTLNWDAVRVAQEVNRCSNDA